MRKRFLKCIPFLLIAALLFSYTFYRAYSFSLTHDEGSSYLNHMQRGMIECMFDPGCWDAANNHLLNSKGMAICSTLFGDWEWSLRLPNLLGHLLYIVSSFVIVYTLSPRYLIRLFGFILLNCQPLLLEFFGLARGYALGVSFELASLCCLVLLFKQKDIKWLIAGLMSGLLAVYSNFTFIPFFVAFLSSIGFILLTRKKSFMPAHIKYGWVSMMFFATLMVVTTYIPVTTLSKNAEFQYGIGSLFDAFQSLQHENLFRLEWLGGNSLFIFTTGFLILVFTSIVIAIRQEWLFLSKDISHFAAALILVLMISFLVLSHYILDAQYPDGRKMIGFIPILCVLIYQLFIWAADRWRIAVSMTSILLSILFVDHLRYAANFDHTRTWYFDGQTKKFLLNLKADMEKRNTQSSIGIHWVFSPASKYYIKTRQISFSKAERLNEIKADTTFDYYYVDQNDTSKLSQHYHIFEQNGPFFLMEKNTLESQ